MERAASIALILLAIGSVSGVRAGEEVTMEKAYWQLVHYSIGNGEWSTVLPETSIDLQLSDGKLAGSAGCNRYMGGYEIDDVRIRFTSQLASTQMACVPPVSEQEQRYLALLGQTYAWKLDDRHLILFNEEGDPILKYQVLEPTSFENTEWQAAGINNGKGGVVSTATTGHSTARFSDGTVSGSGGCNRFNATYEVEDERISIGPAAATRKFCQQPEGIMDQEQQFFAALEKAYSFTVDQGSLELRSEQGSLLVRFRVASDR